MSKVITETLRLVSQKPKKDLSTFQQYTATYQDPRTGENTLPIIGYAENIRDASTTLLSLVNDLLDFSKIECGKMEILPVEYEIANVLSEIMNMIEIKVANKGLDFTPVIAEDIPYLLYGDDVRLRQIIINLLRSEEHTSELQSR